MYISDRKHDLLYPDYFPEESNISLKILYGAKKIIERYGEKRLNSGRDSIYRILYPELLTAIKKMIQKEVVGDYRIINNVGYFNRLVIK